MIKLICLISLFFVTISCKSLLIDTCNINNKLINFLVEKKETNNTKDKEYLHSNILFEISKDEEILEFYLSISHTTPYVFVRCGCNIKILENYNLTENMVQIKDFIKKNGKEINESQNKEISDVMNTFINKREAIIKELPWQQKKTD